MCVCVLFSFLKSGFHSEDSLCGFVIFFCRAGRVGGGWGRFGGLGLCILVVMFVQGLGF